MKPDRIILFAKHACHREDQSIVVRSVKVTEFIVNVIMCTVLLSNAFSWGHCLYHHNAVYVRSIFKSLFLGVTPEKNIVCCVCNHILSIPGTQKMLDLFCVGLYGNRQLLYYICT